MLTLNIKNKIREHCLKYPNNEVYGFIVLTQEGKIEIISNTKIGSPDYFIVDPMDYIRASDLGNIIALYHSHVNENTNFSEHDKINSEQQKLPYILYNIKMDIFNEYYPIGKRNKYIGLDFIYGQQDCFTLIRKYYKEELNFSIMEYEHDEDWYVIAPKIILEAVNQHLNKKIFIEPTDLKKHDILIFQYKNMHYPHHFGIYLENNTFLHHPRNKKSVIDIYDNHWKSLTFKTLRLAYV